MAKIRETITPVARALPMKNKDIPSKDLNIPIVNSDALRQAAVVAAELRDVEFIEQFSTSGQRILAVHGLKPNEMTKLIHCVYPVKGIRVYAYCVLPTDFAVDILGTPTGREADFQKLATISRANTTTYVNGCVGSGVGVKVASLPAGKTVDVFIVIQEEKPIDG